jgi:hypothetical protein
MSLITVNEVLKWSPALVTVNRDLWCNSIEVIERDLFSDCLDLDFRQLMISDRNDFSTVVIYSDAEVYCDKDLVENSGIIYQSLKPNNDKNLLDTKWWKTVSYFKSDKYNVLWGLGMARWIALKVYSENLTYTTFHSGGKGLIKHFEDSGQRTVDQREFFTYKRQIDSDVSMAHKVMMAYIKKNATDLGWIEPTCGDDGCLSQDSDRIAW